MDYSKHFSGSVAVSSAVAAKLLNRDGTLSSTNLDSSLAHVKSAVVGEAIVSTLKDCGMTYAKYYGAVGSGYTSYICFDETADGKPGFYLYLSGSYIYISPGYTYGSDTYIRTLTSASANISGKLSVSTGTFPFSATGALVASSYNFYVRILGDTQGAFSIQYTAYNSTTSYNHVFTVYIAKNVYNNRKVYGFHYGVQLTNANGAAVLLYEDTQAMINNSTSLSAINFVECGTTGVTMLDNIVTLVPLVSGVGSQIQVQNCYIGVQGLDNGAYYYIDGNTYYKANAYLIVKLVTNVTPS